MIIKLKYFLTLLIISSSLVNCQQSEKVETKFKLGADALIDEHLDFLYDKKVGLVVNHTSLLSNGTHILDTLLSLHINIIVVFSPEHGFYGNLERGKMISDSKIRDIKLYSLHGKVKKPAKEMLENLDLIIYDIQDIGVRFYTYVSTLYYVLESAVENNIPMIVLDRPNPNGGLKIVGPVLKNNLKSFLGLTEIPIIYGLTTGELAKFYFKELILNANSSYDFKVFKMKYWNRNMSWNETGIEWIAPSPNITSLLTSIVYPGTCLLEGTNVSEGRGTKEPFLQIGAPFVRAEDLSIEMNEFIDDSFEIYPVSFTPKSIKGEAENPKYENELCNGISIEVKDETKFDAVSFGVKLIYALYKLYPDQFEFNSEHFDLLAGTDQIRKLILNDNTPDFIINSWQEELNKFKSIREKYLLY